MIAVAIGLAVTVGMWLLMLAVADSFGRDSNPRSHKAAGKRRAWGDIGPREVLAGARCSYYRGTYTSQEAMNAADYIAIGVLIACTLFAAVMFLPRRNS